MKLLVAIDSSPSSAQAVRALLSRPWPLGTVVRVLTVADVPLPPAPAFGMPASAHGAEEALRKEAEATTRSMRENIEGSGLLVESRVREGKAGPEIVEEAKEWGADLVLVGSHGRTGLERLLLGSVAQYVVAHAPCSVEVVRGSAEAGMARGWPR